MGERFCNYCNQFKVDDGFKRRVHVASGTWRSMCPLCQSDRKMTPEQKAEAIKERRNVRALEWKKFNEERKKVKDDT